MKCNFFLTDCVSSDGPSITDMVDQAEELGSAYKCIESVMQNQSDLVEPVHELTPMAVLKG
jgi:RNA-splicing ligase RtcB